MSAAVIEARGLGFRYRRAGGRSRARSQGRGPFGGALYPSRSPSRAGALAKSTESGWAGGDRPGFDAVDLDVGPGEVVGLLGRNGAGKSTLLRVLATVRPPTAGSLRLLGRNAVPPARALRRRIAFAGDVPVHIEVLSGRENAIFFARAAGLPAADAARAADALIARLDLEDAALRPASEYSHGMRRKLLLAQALAPAPDLLFLDEPTLGLDSPARSALGDLIRERAAAGTPVVLATHDFVEARRLCDRVVFLHRGRVVLDGPPDELIRATGAGTRIEVRLGGRHDRSDAYRGTDSRFEPGGHERSGSTSVERKGDAGLEPPAVAREGDAGLEPPAVAHEGDAGLEPPSFEREGDAGLESPAVARGGHPAPPAVIDPKDIERHISHIEVLRAEPDVLDLRSLRGAAVLPALCALLIDRGLEIREIMVREPDLDDVFHQATGARLDGGRGAASLPDGED